VPDLFSQKMKKKTLVMSGAMSTMLAREGANLGGCVSQWIVDHPEVYQDLVRDYYQVGCDIVSAATSSLNRVALSKFGLADKTEELNQRVIQIIKAVQPQGTFVSGNIGPTGKFLKPLGELTLDELLDAYGQQAKALAAGGAEIINILTMYDLEEAVAALHAAKFHTGLPIIVSLAFNPAAQGYRTMMGVSPQEAAQRLQAEGADVIGANCGSLDLEQVTEVLHLLKAHCGKPLIAKPNAGSPQVVEGREQYSIGPHQFAEHVPQWLEAGAGILSACCGSSPAHLKEIVKKVQEIGQG